MQVRTPFIDYVYDFQFNKRNSYNITSSFSSLLDEFYFNKHSNDNILSIIYEAKLIIIIHQKWMLN